MWLAEVREKAKRKNQMLFSKDSLLLDELCQLVAQANRRVLVLWALELAEESARVLAEKYPEWEMQNQAILHCIDYTTGKVTIDGNEYQMREWNLPTVDPNDPYKLTDEEMEVMLRLRLVLCQD